MEYWIILSLIAFFLVGLWNINLMNIKEYSHNHIFTWFRIMFVITGFLSFLSFFFFKPDIKITHLEWKYLIYSGALLFAYQLLLLYIFSTQRSVFPLIIINLNIVLVILYQTFKLKKPIANDLLALLVLYLIIGSAVIYRKHE